MYLWRCCVAVILAMMWYFTDCAPTTVTQFLWVTGVCILCYMSTPLLFQDISWESKNISRERSSIQTEQSLQEDRVDDQLDFTTHFCSKVTGISLEPLCPDLKKSVQQVIECIYNQYLHPWYPDAEPRKDQPLHQVLSRESDFIIDRVICRGTDLNVCKTIVGSIHILTEHIRNAKNSNRHTSFQISSRTDEIAVLRKFSEALVRNLLPVSLWGQDAICCALNEIIALKALEMVSWMSEPYNLNKLLVTCLDKGHSNQTHDNNCEGDQIVTDCFTAGIEESKEHIDLDDYLKDNMWCDGRWALSIPHVEWKNEELVFTVHLEEQDGTENLHWDIKKTYMDVIGFRNRLQDSANLPLISELPKGSEEMISDGIKEEVRASVEHFLQGVVADERMGHSQPVFQFLCPLELKEEERDLLSALATLLTAGQQGDELHSSHIDARKEDLSLTSSPEPTILTAEETSEASDNDCDIVTDGLCVEGWSFGGKSARKEKPGLDTSDGLQKAELKKAQRKASLKEHRVSDAIMDLLTAISGNSFFMKTVFKHGVMPFMSDKVRTVISKMIPTEEKMTAYINDLCEQQWPGGSPAPFKPKPSSHANKTKPTDEDRHKTRDKAFQLICDQYSSLFKTKELERVFQLFQSSLESKRLVYRLLSFLLTEFIPGEIALKDSLQKVN